MKNKILGMYEDKFVFVDGSELILRYSQLCNHSTVEFDWGKNGPGLTQLALGILLRFTDEETAIWLHHKFKAKVLIDLPQSDFDLEFDIREWLEKEEKKEHNKTISTKEE